MDHQLYIELARIKEILQYQAEQITKLVQLMEEETTNEEQQAKNERIREKTE